MAALDLGTNSTRFLVGRQSGAGFSPDSVVDRDTVVTRLGEDVDKRGVLSEEAMNRVLEQVSEYDERVRGSNGHWVDAVATSACRRARNGGEFLDRIESLIGLPPEIISGVREAELTFHGVHASVPGINTGRVIDIGGGSTEWITFADNQFDELSSASVGVVTLRERFGNHADWDVESISDARSVVGEHLPDTVGQGPLIVVGGTGTTLSAHAHQLDEYRPEVVHGDRLALSAIEEIRRAFESMTYSELRELPMIQPGREDVMLPGIVILEEFARFADVSEVIISDYGILAGILEEATTVEL